VTTAACGSPAFAQYRSNGDGTYHPWSLTVLEFKNGAIASWNAFLDVERLFPLFKLPHQPPIPAEALVAVG
jgi:RNA polymerase sigma-70 factor (ECF subfamily)